MYFPAAVEERMIDRITELKADNDILFADAKDGLVGFKTGA